MTLNINPQGAALTTPSPRATNISFIQGNSSMSSPTALFWSLQISTPALATFLLFKQGIKLFPITLASFSSTHSSFMDLERFTAISPSLALFNIVTNHGYFFTTSLRAALPSHTFSMCFSLSFLECCPPSCPPSHTISAPRASPSSLVILSNVTKFVKYLSASAASSRWRSSAKRVAFSLTLLPKLSLVTNSTLVAIELPVL
mmetsp:Transcript_7138/g.14434  ORF Transcript_7138/g.14434 Transcript_7138/m.14434 type:complete len:202 (-) Transcript_7138:2758-3363(-)